MSRLTDEQLISAYNSQLKNGHLKAIRAVAEAAVTAYIKHKNIELPVAKRWKGEVPKSLGGGHIWTYISRDEKVPEGTYWEPLFTHPLPNSSKPAVANTESSKMKQQKECLGRDKCLALANAVLNDMDCHPAFVKAMAADGGPVKEKSTRLTTAELIDRAKCTLKESNELINASKMAVPEGYALVPIEPTSVMVDAGYDAYGKAHFTLAIIDCFRAMVLATQKEPHL